VCPAVDASAEVVTDERDQAVSETDVHAAFARDDLELMHAAQSVDGSGAVDAVQDDDLVALLGEMAGEVVADEACAAGYEVSHAPPPGINRTSGSGMTHVPVYPGHRPRISRSKFHDAISIIGYSLIALELGATIGMWVPGVNRPCFLGESSNTKRTVSSPIPSNWSSVVSLAGAPYTATFWSRKRFPSPRICRTASWRRAVSAPRIGTSPSHWRSAALRDTTRIDPP